MVELALRQQLAVLKHERPRPRIRPIDRVFWVVLRHFWSRWAEMLMIVKPVTVVKWHRGGYRLFWRRISRLKSTGRPPIDAEIRALI